MGKGRRARPRFLAKKLREIRLHFGVSQNDMLRTLGLNDEFTRAELSAYERGVREPPLEVLLSYSKTARIWLNVLVDDDLDLPVRFAKRGMNEGRPRQSSTKLRL